MSEKMPEMVERIAKALYEERNGPGCYPWGNRPKAHKDEYRADARAALKTIREPGLAIRKITTFEFAEVEWPKLIDAALATPPAEWMNDGREDRESDFPA